MWRLGSIKSGKQRFTALLYVCLSCIIDAKILFFTYYTIVSKISVAYCDAYQKRYDNDCQYITLNI